MSCAPCIAKRRRRRIVFLVIAFVLASIATIRYSTRAHEDAGPDPFTEAGAASELALEQEIADPDSAWCSACEFSASLMPGASAQQMGRGCGPCFPTWNMPGAAWSIKDAAGNTLWSLADAGSTGNTNTTGYGYFRNSPGVTFLAGTGMIAGYAPGTTAPGFINNSSAIDVYTGASGTRRFIFGGSDSTFSVDKLRPFTASGPLLLEDSGGDDFMELEDIGGTTATLDIRQTTFQLQVLDSNMMMVVGGVSPEARFVPPITAWGGVTIGSDHPDTLITGSPSDTVALTFNPLGAGDCETVAATVEGAVAGSVCMISEASSGLGCSNIASIWAVGAGADSVDVRACASAAAGCLDISGNYNIRCMNGF